MRYLIFEVIFIYFFYEQNGKNGNTNKLENNPQFVCTGIYDVSITEIYTGSKMFIDINFISVCDWIY